MTPLRLLTATALSASALATVPMAVAVVFTPAISSACLPGETAGASACAAVLPARQGARRPDRIVCAGARPGSQRSQPADQRLLSRPASEFTSDALVSGVTDRDSCRCSNVCSSHVSGCGAGGDGEPVPRPTTRSTPVTLDALTRTEVVSVIDDLETLACRMPTQTHRLLARLQAETTPAGDGRQILERGVADPLAAVDGRGVAAAARGRRPGRPHQPDRAAVGAAAARRGRRAVGGVDHR